MAGTLLPNNFKGWYYYLTALAGRNSVGTQLSKRSGAIQYGVSTSGAAYIAYGLYYNVFSATGGLTTRPVKLFDIPGEFRQLLTDAVNTVSSGT
jgi:hypothetical protein